MFALSLITKSDRYVIFVLFEKEFDDNEEINYLYSLISSLENKKNKTRQERDTLDLLKIKLN